MDCTLNENVFDGDFPNTHMWLVYWFLVETWWEMWGERLAMSSASLMSFWCVFLVIAGHIRARPSIIVSYQLTINCSILPEGSGNCLLAQWSGFFGTSKWNIVFFITAALPLWKVRLVEVLHNVLAPLIISLHIVSCSRLLRAAVWFEHIPSRKQTCRASLSDCCYQCVHPLGLR